MTKDREVTATGGCQCGAIRYALYAAPENPHLCHCSLCQRAVGGAFAALAPVRRRDFAWTKGEPSEFNSSPKAARGFCSACGTPLSFRYLESDWIDVTIGSLDEPAKVAPKLHYGAESRLTWTRHFEELPDKETQPGGLTGNVE